MTPVQDDWRAVVDPRVLWPREVADFHPWLIGNLDRLAPWVGVERLEYVGREMPVGERWTHTGPWPIAAALARRGSWPALGGWDGAVQRGRRAWVAYAAYGDGIEVYEMGWTG